MLFELQSQKGPNTWNLVSRLVVKKVKVITCLLDFVVRHDERGRITRHKARLVIHGHKQQHGVNYSITSLQLSGLKPFEQLSTIQLSVAGAYGSTM